MSAICSNSEGRKPEVALTFNSRWRGEVVCTPRGAPSGEDGAVGGGEHLRDGQIRFSGPSWSSEAEQALLFLTRVSGATRRSHRGGLSRAFTIYPLAGALARSGTTTGSLDRVRWGMYRIAQSIGVYTRLGRKERARLPRGGRSRWEVRTERVLDCAVPLLHRTNEVGEDSGRSISKTRGEGLLPRPGNLVMQVRE